MKVLLTSSGITNESIRKALLDLLGKPTAEAKALYVPTAIYALPGGIGHSGRMSQAFDLGWAEYGTLELTALPSPRKERWLPQVEAADVLFVGGGGKAYLSYWLYTSGLAQELPELLQNTVYVGMSAGSMMVTQGINVDREQLERTGIHYDDEYGEAAPMGVGSDKTLKLVDFVVRPHLNADYFPAATPENMERWAARAGVPLYAMDDQTAIKVVNDDVKVVSEGEWKLFDKKRP